MPLFRRKPAPVISDDHAVLTHLPLSDDGFGTADERKAVRELEERIAKAVAWLGGEHDGNEFGGGEAMLYTYGPDADRLFDAIRECLDGFEVRPGVYAIKRYGRATTRTPAKNGSRCADRARDRLRRGGCSAPGAVRRGPR